MEASFVLHSYTKFQRMIRKTNNRVKFSVHAIRFYRETFLSIYLQPLPPDPASQPPVLLLEAANPRALPGHLIILLVNVRFACQSAVSILELLGPTGWPLLSVLYGLFIGTSTS